MSEVTANITINESDKVISLTGIRADTININFSGDIDFTELVEELTKLIDKRNTIVLNKPSSAVEDEKITMVVSTLTEIVNKYNESITVVDITGQVGLEVDDDLPL